MSSGFFGSFGKKDKPASGSGNDPIDKPGQPGGPKTGELALPGAVPKVTTTQPMIVPKYGDLKPVKKSSLPGKSTQRIILPGAPDIQPDNTVNPQIAETVALPMPLILRLFPENLLAVSLKEFETSAEATQEISLPVSAILPQLPSGRIEMTIQDLVPHIPAHLLKSPSEMAAQMSTVVRLPLMDIVMRIPPDLLALRSDQREVDSSVTSMNDPFVIENIHAETPQEESMPPASPQGMRVLPPVAPKSFESPPTVVTPVPKLMTQSLPDFRKSTRLPAAVPPSTSSTASPSMESGLSEPKETLKKTTVPLPRSTGVLPPITSIPVNSKDELVSPTTHLRDESSSAASSGKYTPEPSSSPSTETKEEPNIFSEESSANVQWSQSDEMKKLLAQAEASLNEEAPSLKTDPNNSSQNLSPTSTLQEGEEIDLNQGDAQALQRVSGCSKEIADKIVSYRQEHGFFEKLEDLLKVSGVTPAIYESLTGFPPPPKLELSEVLGLAAGQKPSPKEIADRVTSWLDITGCIILEKKGLTVASHVPPSVKPETISAFVPRLFEELNRSFKEISGKEANQISIPNHPQSYHFFSQKELLMVLIAKCEQLPERYNEAAQFILEELSANR